MNDRCLLVPPHAGFHVLPNSPLFSRLLRFAARSPAHVAIADARSGHQRTHLELLSDVLALRENVLNSLRSLSVQEAAYYVEKSHAAVVLVSSSDQEKGDLLEKLIRSASDEHFQSGSIAFCTFAPTLSAAAIQISSDRALQENSPVVVIFTSGTTGPPKGAVTRRSFVSDCALSVADHLRLTGDDVMLHVLPVHHAMGVGINSFPFLISGSRFEFRSGGFDEKWMWERWKEGAMDSSRRLTFFSGFRPYVAGARQFRACLCGTIMQKRIRQRYGAKELGAIFMVGLDNDKGPDGSVGECVSGVDVKLSAGDEGEVLVRSAHMFRGYLRDAQATAQAHDEEGYFRTGDIARREVANGTSYYYMVGRASLDVIKSGGYKTSALDVERELLALPYIAEAVCCGVSDEEFGQRVAALVSVQDEEHVLNIGAVRKDLQGRLAGYKMPTLLRIVNGELPNTSTGKVQKSVLGPQYFGQVFDPEVQRWERPLRELAKL
ncbi:acetyl-CoA synthetase-like protein [Karstenula rhodostoma CBS 690.94]|uniref:Acetyl-CoA synthetase-like protein n=1 Tax=Karstenula rhodostoma CBS 690.94 TaxID=1392251 RepID=A0A9P4UA57_9PLEO|nr:acetyl-CoA synthetase-like protein [Karstenula rhodostoma CBS 690.94]